MSIEALRSGTARVGGKRLVQFMAGLNAVVKPPWPPTLICHSYSTIVCASAVNDSGITPISSLVLCGSPGVDLRRAADLGLQMPVYSALAAKDWIGSIPAFRWLGFGHSMSPRNPKWGAVLRPRLQRISTPWIRRPVHILNTYAIPIYLLHQSALLIPTLISSASVPIPGLIANTVGPFWFTVRFPLLLPLAGLLALLVWGLFGRSGNRKTVNDASPDDASEQTHSSRSQVAN